MRDDDLDELQLEVHAAEPGLSPRQREEAERSFRFTLGRFAAALRRVDVAVGPAASADAPGWVRCRVSATGRHGEMLFVEASDRDVAACVGRALRRAEREMRRRARRSGSGWRGAA